MYIYNNIYLNVNNYICLHHYIEIYRERKKDWKSPVADGEGKI